MQVIANKGAYLAKHFNVKDYPLQRSGSSVGTASFKRSQVGATLLTKVIIPADINLILAVTYVRRT